MCNSIISDSSGLKDKSHGPWVGAKKMNQCKRLLLISVIIWVHGSVEAGNEGSATEALFNACKGKQVEAVTKSIAEGTDTNAVDKRGLTPLAIAVSSGHVEITDLLSANGAKMDQVVAATRNRSQESPRVHVLMLALQAKNTDMIRHLLDKGADPLTPNSWGLSPLCQAALSGKLRMFEMLSEKAPKLGRRIWVDKGHSGTLLHAAVMGGNQKIVESLLDRGLNIEGRDSGQQSPLNLAVGRDDLEMTNLLISRGDYLYASTSWSGSAVKCVNSCFSHLSAVRCRKTRFSAPTAES